MSYRHFNLIFRRFLRYKKKDKQRESVSWDSLCRTIDYEFKHPDLLRQALTHRSSLENSNEMQSNERLEFLGDAILGWVVTDVLYRHFPECNEGDLTRAKSMIVSRDTLAKTAKKIKLGRYLILGIGEDRSGGRVRRSILANAYEALLGAIYLDDGVEDVKRIIQEHLLTDIDRIITSRFHHNYKSWLLEHLQAIYKRSPRYQILNEKGPDHRKEFTVEVLLDGKSLGKGRGASKKRAEQSAARDALNNMGIISKNTEEQ